MMLHQRNSGKDIYNFCTWSTYTIKEGSAEYDVSDIHKFTLNWVNSIQDDFHQPNDGETKSGHLTVKVPKFDVQNWYEVKSAFTLMLA